MRCSADELRALGGVSGIRLPRFVTAGRIGRDPAAVDAAALRGLAARDLVTLLPEVRLTPRLTSLFAPCVDPELVAEIEVESDGGISRVGVVGSLRFTERPAGLVDVEPGDGDVLTLLGVDDLVDGGDDLSLRVGTDDYLAADDLVTEGADAVAVRLLVVAGATEAAAEAWVDTVRGRRRTVSVALARDLGARYVAAELCWVVAPDGTAWRVATEPAGGTPDWDADADTPTVTTVRQVTRKALRDALAQVLVPAEVTT